MSATTAVVWIRRYIEQSELDPCRQGTSYGSQLDVHQLFILDLVEQREYMTLTEMVGRLAPERDVRVVITALWYWLYEQASSYKKRGARR